MTKIWISLTIFFGLVGFLFADKGGIWDGLGKALAAVFLICYFIAYFSRHESQGDRI